MKMLVAVILSFIAAKASARTCDWDQCQTPEPVCHSVTCLQPQSLCSTYQAAIATAYRASSPMVPLTSSISESHLPGADEFLITLSGSGVQKIYDITVRQNDCQVQVIEPR